MSRASRARRAATAAAVGGGGVGALGAAAYGVLWGETKLARRRIAPAESDPPAADGVWSAPGVAPDATPIRMAMLGDSSAAGYGVHTEAETPGAVIALGLSEQARRPVRLTNVAVVGAQSADLGGQVGRILADDAELAVIMIGANDVTHRIRRTQSIRCLADALAVLHGAGVAVVVGTCPDLGTIRPIPPPLRWVARRLSRNLAAAQAVVVVAGGGRAVSLGYILGPEFATRRDLFSEDQFHPSAAGYARAAEVLLPTVADALGLQTVPTAAGPFTSTRPRPVSKAAALAVARPGTEVSPASRKGESAGRRGPWARLARRRTSEVDSDTRS